MHKEPHKELELLVKECNSIAKSQNKTIQISPYIISAHPGCKEEDARKMVQKLKNLGLTVRGFQDFTPTPGTISTAMHYSEIDKETKQPLFIPRDGSRKKQRSIMERGFFQENSPKRKRGKKISPHNKKWKKK